MEEATTTYAADLLQEYTERIDAIVESAQFEWDQWSVAEAAPQALVFGTPSPPTTYRFSPRRYWKS